MGRDQDGGIARREVLGPRHERVLAGPVEPARRLVQTDEPREDAVSAPSSHHDRQREPLALTAREVARIRGGGPIEAHRLQRGRAGFPGQLVPHPLADKQVARALGQEGTTAGRGNLAARRL